MFVILIDSVKYEQQHRASPSIDYIVVGGSKLGGQGHGRVVGGLKTSYVNVVTGNTDNNATSNVMGAKKKLS